MQPAVESGIPVGERIATLDILRGFALLGILIMNMSGFSTSFFAEADGSRLWPGAIDQFAESARDMLFSGKFNSMFSLLFGIGFTIQFARMERRDPEGASALYLRRLAVLAVIGVTHATLFWQGDVLHIYAMLGLLLVFPLRRARPRTIVLLIVLCALFPVVSGMLRLVVTTPEITAMLVARAQAMEAADNAAYGSGSFVDAARQHALTMKFFYDNGWSLWGTLGFWVQMAMTMLIGLLAGRLLWVQRIPELMPQVRRWMWVALGVGLACGAAFTLIFHFNRVPGPSPIKFVGSLCYWTSRPAMMIFYVLAIVRLAQDPAWARRLAPLAVAGRMPLTNYLMQTAICTTLFYAWGFGLWGKVGPAW
ncbi:MAG: DUF418 domain-containing protein, partial [Betaproteobacteria bacterium]|nr:DUF418 domain-containing protein [Betaproteobacteria bacterium]